MFHEILILGGGTGGTLTANRLHRHYGESAHITVVDRDDRHVYQPGLLFVPFGLADPERLVRSRRAQLRPGIDFRLGDVEAVDAARSRVTLTDGATLLYDVLVIATGAALAPEETEGLPGPGWDQSVFTFYTLPGAVALRDALTRFGGGRIAVNLIDMPIKCPVAPLEFCFLADWHFARLGLRDRVSLSYVTPLDAAFTQPVASRELSDLLAAKHIELVTEFATGSVDAARRRLCSWDEREVSFDLLVTIPLHVGAPFVADSPGLGDELGFIDVDPGTLRARCADNVFALGDATNVPASKAGSVAHFEGDTVVENVRRVLAGDDPLSSFDGHTNCFIETGFHKALLIDFNYDTEPLPGRFPEPHLGPLPLLAQSRRNHAGKLAFEWLYWHMLLPGRPLPGVTARMQTAGKDTSLIST